MSDSGNPEEEESASDRSSEEGESGHPMMSIFASYYGIEDPSQVEAGPTGTIDDADFDPTQYVHSLLSAQPLEKLLSHDGDMVQEIRTLDGEMQKLVYDNYNKFITATETIKEMKRDVYAMDADMEAVRLKMRQIAQGSGVLDLVLQPTRSKVDKLVRVRRLLQRLEFLNELPARLETMIRHKRYTEAVHLYKKTISVLTRHSHVLSFKKIKERTEVMMTELTHQVIDLLEDPSLEAVKLTQYISVLRLMGAPAEKVSHKLLSAHRARSQGMITSFNQSLLTQQALSTYTNSTYTNSTYTNSTHSTHSTHSTTGTYSG
eukprot:CAMPEP_0173198724 /NCGR_PEP_ID=MMETSP1141-20130122/16839_1 /TAXON_ID=483371 /ORGANISM="non described non described, Strain CCMP2298" /LENGTH=317 /DNA_ID=CAMNT_0014123535 /DNA_START=59 /DNA_END=1008 /DNA_ORIENTATION=-